MRFALCLTAFILLGCQSVSPSLSRFDVHANPALFSGPKLPKIDVIPPLDYRGPLSAFQTHVRYFDVDYNEVTTANRAGRYGAVVEVRAKGQSLFRYLTLCRTPNHVDWDGARMEMLATFPPQLGISTDDALRQRKDVAEFFKYTIQHAAQTQTNESNWQVAAMVAGLYEASRDGSDHDGAFVERDGFAAVDQRWWFGLKQKLGRLGWPYRVYFPNDYENDSKRGRPLIVFLHGSGEAGDGGPELDKIEKGGLPKLVKTHDPALPKDFPFIVLAPQLPPYENWSPYELTWLIDQFCETHAVDRDRIYLTGLSLGGYGVWDTAIAFPDRFAAIAPIAGAGDPADVERIKSLPVWIFHGEKDPTVPVEEAHRMADALTKIGSPPKLTIYPDARHNSWDKGYRTPELYEWFLAHRRSQ